MADIREITSNLIQDNESGIWHSSGATKVSFPLQQQKPLLAIEENSFWFRHRNKCLAAILGNFPPNGILFDIGGGNGYVSKGLQDLGFDCVLVEPGLDGAINAKRRGVETVICSTIQDSGFQDGSLSAIGMFDVLEHIENEKEILGTIARTLRPGGMLYLSIPAYNSLWSFEDIFAGHFRRYTISSLRKLLAQFDFEVLFSSYMFFFLPIPVFFLRSIPTMLRLRTAYDHQKAVKAHAGSSGRTSNLLKRFLDFEHSRIKEGKRMPFGSSVVLAAHLK